MKMTHVLTGLVLASALSITSLSVMAESNASAPEAGSQHQEADWQARMQQHMDARIERIATLLQLSDAQKASAAWNNYANALRDLGKHGQWKSKQERENADAATIARARADAVAKMANKLSTLADATSALQAKLNDAQRKAFDQLAHQEGEMHSMHHRFGGFDHGHDQ